MSSVTNPVVPAVVLDLDYNYIGERIPGVGDSLYCSGTYFSELRYIVMNKNTNQEQLENIRTKLLKVAEIASSRLKPQPATAQRATTAQHSQSDYVMSISEIDYMVKDANTSLDNLREIERQATEIASLIFTKLVAARQEKMAVLNIGQGPRENDRLPKKGGNLECSNGKKLQIPRPQGNFKPPIEVEKDFDPSQHYSSSSSDVPKEVLLCEKSILVPGYKVAEDSVKKFFKKEYYRLLKLIEQTPTTASEELSILNHMICELEARGADTEEIVRLRDKMQLKHGLQLKSIFEITPEPLFDQIPPPRKALVRSVAASASEPTPSASASEPAPTVEPTPRRFRDENKEEAKASASASSPETPIVEEDPEVAAARRKTIAARLRAAGMFGIPR